MWSLMMVHFVSLDVIDRVIVWKFMSTSFIVGFNLLECWSAPFLGGRLDGRKQTITFHFFDAELLF